MGDSRPVRTLQDYFTLQRGVTYQSRLLDSPGPVLLGLASIARNGGFRRDSLRTYGGDSPPSLLVHPGDLYLSLKDVTQSADLLGAVARLPVDHAVGRLTQDTVRLEPKGAGAPISYLYWLLRTPQYRRYCRAHSTGTTNLGLSRDDLLAFPVPELTPHRALTVEALEALEQKIELNRRMNETLEAMARALFKSWFVDFDPVRAKAEGRQPSGMDAETAKLFPSELVDSELGPIPKGWRVSTVGEFVQLRRGTTYNGLLVGRPGPALLGLGSIRPGGGFRHDGFKTYGGECPPAITLQRGDLYVSLKGATKDGDMIGSVARVPVVVPRGRLTQDTVKLQLSDDRLATFFYRLLLLPEYRAYCANRAMGSAVVALSREDFLSYPLVMSPEAVLERLTAVLGVLESRAEQSVAETRELIATRDTLLPRLLSGGLAVGESDLGGTSGVEAQT